MRLAFTVYIIFFFCVDGFISRSVDGTKVMDLFVLFVCVCVFALAFLNGFFLVDYL